MDDGKDAQATVQLVSTVPGIEMHIDLRSKYVSLISAQTVAYGPTTFGSLYEDQKRSEHLPIWQESVILICEEGHTRAVGSRHC